MTEVLSQEQIDELLRAINSGVDEGRFTRPIRSLSDLADRIFKGKRKSSNTDESIYLKSIDTFQSVHYNVDKSNINQVYNDVSLIEPQVIFKIGSVEFVPIHMCPHCKKYHYQEEIQHGYDTDTPTPEFAQKNRSLSPFRLKRKWLTDNRTIRCRHCSKRFQPTIVIRNTLENVPYFCPTQLVDALDKWFLTIRKSKIQLFSTQTKTVYFRKSRTTLYWDVFLNDPVNGLSTCPHTLLSNLIRMTPAKDLERMIIGEKGIPVCNGYNFNSYYKSTQIFNEI